MEEIEKLMAELSIAQAETAKYREKYELLRTQLCCAEDDEADLSRKLQKFIQDAVRKRAKQIHSTVADR